MMAKGLCYQTYENFITLLIVFFRLQFCAPFFGDLKFEGAEWKTKASGTDN